MADQSVVQGCTLGDSERLVPGERDRSRRDAIERVVPGETARAVYLHHVARYEFASRFVKGKAVLDVACGSGYGAPILSKAGARAYTGLDISSEALSVAMARYKVSENISFRFGDACELGGIGDETVDVAVSFETIEHVSVPNQFLASLRRVLRPGGILIISTPNRVLCNPLGSLDSRSGNPFHLREWTTKEFTRLLLDYFTVDQVLGQELRSLAHARWKRWKAIVLREAETHPTVWMLTSAYRSARSACVHKPSAESQQEAPVLTVKPWQCQSYVVCVCRRAPRNHPRRSPVLGR